MNLLLGSTARLLTGGDRSELLGGGVHAATSSHFVTKRDCPALVGFDFRQMKVDVFVEFFKEPYPVANQDRHDRITNFVGQPETKALAGNCATSDKPDGTERAPQAPIHELDEIA